MKITEAELRELQQVFVAVRLAVEYHSFCQEVESEIYMLAEHLDLGPAKEDFDPLFA